MYSMRKYLKYHLSQSAAGSSCYTKLPSSRIARVREGWLLFCAAALSASLCIHPLSANAENVSGDKLQNESQVETEKAGAFGKKLLQARQDTTEQDAVGQAVPDFNSAARSTTKSFMFVISVLLIGLAAFKKFSRKNAESNGQDAIELVAKRSLGSRSFLLVAKIEGRKFLLAQNGDDVSLLSELDPPPDFQEALRQLAVVDESNGERSVANSNVHG